MAFALLARLCVVVAVGTATARADSADIDADEVVLLQGRATVKSSPKAPVRAGSHSTAEEASRRTSPDFCSEGASASSNAASPRRAAASWEATAPGGALSVPDATPAPPSVVLAASGLGASWKADTDSVSPNCIQYGFARILEVLIVAIVIDGVRRWRANARATKQAAGATSPGGGWEALMECAMKGDEKLCMQMLSFGLPSVALSRVDVWGCTVLHAAAKGGSVAVVQCLVEAGAAVSDRDAWDETPLHIAARAGHSECCRVLLAAGAEVDLVNADGYSPLVLAGKAGSEATCRALLDASASAAGLLDDELPPFLAAMILRGVIVPASSLATALPGAETGLDDGLDPWN